MIIQFKITLQGSKPAIWRRIQVNANLRMDRFHQVIQIVMGWENAHLHEFNIGDRRIGMIDHGFVDVVDPNEEEETKVFLKDLDLSLGNIFRYLYDFGDSWDHLLEIESILEDEVLFFPKCMEGSRTCPPEDCGGIWGYMHVMEVLKNPKHPEYEHWKEWWSEDFDPNGFDLDEINQELKRFGMWHNKNPEKKSTPWHMIHG